MASTDAKPVPVKNAAYRVIFPIFDADGDLVTGATGLDSEVSKDQGTFADCTNEATEIATASGMYYLDLTSTEMNADCVAVIVKTTSSGAKTTPIVLYPQEAGDIPVDVQSISGDSTAADNLEAAADGTGYNLGGGSVVAVSVTADSVHAGTAQAGGSATVTLAAGASATNDIYNYQRIDITSGTGAGQSAIITDYDGTTKVATVDHAWQTTPDNTSVYRVVYARVPRDVSKVTGDVEGKILGTTSGGGTMSGAGVWAYDHTGAAISGGGGLDASGVRSAIGLASANLDTQLSGINSKTTNLPSDPADASDIASSFSTVNSTLATIAGYIDTEVTAIKAKTDLIPASPAAVGSAMTLADGAITSAKFASGAIDSAAIATDAFGALELAAGAASEIAVAVVDQALSGHTTAGTVGGALNSAGSGSLDSAGADPTGTPGPTATYKQKVDWMFAMFCNAQTTTKTLQTVADSGGTPISEATISSDGTTVTRGEFADP